MAPEGLWPMVWDEGQPWHKFFAADECCTQWILSGRQDFRDPMRQEGQLSAHWGGPELHLR